MADFVAVLRKTLDGLGETTPAMRERVYEKARQTIAAKLAAINPPPPPSVADRQKRALDEAIATIERDYTGPESDPLAELENVFASLKNPQPKPLAPPPVIKSEAWPKTSPAARAPMPTPPRQPAPVPKPAVVAEPTFDSEAESDVDDIDDRQQDFEPREEPARRQRSYGGVVAAAIVLAVLAGGGYGAWLNRDAFSSLFGGAAPQTADTVPAAAEPPADVAAAPAEPAPDAEAPAPVAAAGSEDGKFTQRLTPEGSEIDPGPANGAPSVAEGTSVAALTQPPTAPAAPPAEMAPTDTPPATAEAVPPAATTPPAEAAPAASTETALPVGQKAIFYEERTNASEGSAEPGSIVWSLVQESPGGDRPPEPAIRAEATIPGKDVQLRMTIRRNADQTLPASHIIEMIFLTPEGFEGGGIENILRIAMKNSEQEAGSPLIGIPAKIADGFFLVALNDTRSEIDANMTLLRRQSWIDVPIVYKSGRRALFTMEKGIPGEKVFEEAMKAWQTASASTSAPG